MIQDPLSQAYAVRATRLGTNARVLLLQLAGGGNESTDDTAEMIDDVELLQPLGLFVRPFITARTEAFGFELGDEVVATHLLDKSGGGGASPVPFNDVDAGETRLYGAKEAASRVRLRADGSLDIEAKAGQAIRVTHPSGAKFWINGDGSIDVLSAPGKDVNVDAGGAGEVVLNGGGLKAARVTDPVQGGTLTGTAGPYPLVLTFQPFDADGTPAGVPSSGPTVTLSGVVSNAGGAARTKA